MIVSKLIGLGLLASLGVMLAQVDDAEAVCKNEADVHPGAGGLICCTEGGSTKACGVMQSNINGGPSCNISGTERRLSISKMNNTPTEARLTCTAGGVGPSFTLSDFTGITTPGGSPQSVVRCDITNNCRGASHFLVQAF